MSHLDADLAAQREARPELWIENFLHRIGIEEFKPEIRLHRRLASALRDAGAHRPLGAHIAAARYVVRDEHGRAGDRLATARAAHEEMVRDRMIELLQGPEKVTVALAKLQAEQAGAEERRTWLRAEQAERTLREFLKALADDLDNHQTDRADRRAGDRAHADGVES